MTDNALTVTNTGGDYLVPAALVGTVLATYQAKKVFIAEVLKDGTDYGKIPGTDKPALYKAGAEKMSTFFGLAPVFEDVCTVEDWLGADHGGEPFFYYRQKCKLYRGDRLIATADGSCNSREKKYRYRWMNETEIPAHVDKSKLVYQDGSISEFTFAVDKAETGGKYGKPAAYWQQFKDAIANNTATKIRKKSKDKEFDAWQIGGKLYAVPNPDVAELVNTILKMAQKRALVAAVLIATNVSDYFTQDIDDYVTGDVMDAVFHEVKSEKPGGDVTKSEPAAVTAARELGGVVVDAPPMTYEEACAVENSKGQRYGDIDTETLEGMEHGINKGMKKPGADVALYQLKLQAIGIILAARAADNDAARQAENE